jgi:hypothetical protein
MYHSHTPPPTPPDCWNNLVEPTGTYKLRVPTPDAGISMHASGGDEMIKIAKDGFYVRGKKIPQDDKEAEAVYNAFKQWLAWANLQQQR